jgi:hypothetical protein
MVDEDKRILTDILRIPGPLALILRRWRFRRNQIRSFAAGPPDCSAVCPDLAAFPRSRHTSGGGVCRIFPGLPFMRARAAPEGPRSAT